MAAILARLLVGLALLVANRAVAGGVETATTDESKQEEPSVSTDEDSEAAERAKVVEVGVWVLLGVVVLAGVVVTTLLMYGAHARRVARAPLPERTRDDPLWYLRKSKTSTADRTKDDPDGEPADSENEPDPEP